MEYLRSVGGMWPERSFRPNRSFEPGHFDKYALRSLRLGLHGRAPRSIKRVKDTTKPATGWGSTGAGK